MGESVFPATSAALDLTHVLYDPESTTSTLLALITLSPILLMSAYAALAVQTRQLTIILMWAGQLACEATNYIVKNIVKQERPFPGHGDGYGFPSSHSQWMGYFSAFLVCHLYFRHRFATFGQLVLDVLLRLAVYAGILAWAVGVAYSRYHLLYHSPAQVVSGFSIGALFGTVYYIIVEAVPLWYPTSVLGRFRTWVVGNPLSTYFRLKDGWNVWPDGGYEAEWKAWRIEWERRVQAKTKTQ